MAIDKNDPPSEKVVPFPGQPPSIPPYSDDMKLDLSNLGICDDLTDQIKQQKLRETHSFSWRLVVMFAFAIILFLVAIWSHFSALNISETLRNNPENLDYDQLVTWHTATARQIANLGFISKASFVTALALSLTSFILYRNNRSQ
jgi:hypothetical protein